MSERINRFKDFFRDKQLSGTVTIDYKELEEWDKQVASVFLSSPDIYLYYMTESVKFLTELEEVIIHIKNIPKKVGLRKLSVRHNFKFINMEGVVSKVGRTKSMVEKGMWECKEGHLTEVDYDINVERITPPAKCTDHGCKQSSGFEFKPQHSIFRDSQHVILQEKPEVLPAGQIPKTVSVLLLDDLVDMSRCGDRASVNGILRLRQTNSKSKMFTPYLQANYVEILDKEPEEVELSEEELSELNEVIEDPFVYQRLIRSFAPSIKFNEHVKESIIYALFGGVRKEKRDVSTRGNLTVLLIGDPSTAKTQLLLAGHRLAYRGIFTSGKGSTAAGLTASVVQNENKEWMLEAGALVLADRGIAFIDELEKMDKKDQSAIHVAMEQQIVPIHKAGINTTLNARCGIVASINPTFGRYDIYKTPAENINVLQPTILSRFDLIFIMKDKPEETKDDAVSKRILGMAEQEIDLPLISPDLIRKWIAYSKSVNPKLDKEARKYLKDFFLKMRTKIDEDSPIPISYRQLEGMIRITEAHARIRLKKEATIEDARSAVVIMMRSLEDVGLDPETGKIDIDARESGITKKEKDKYDLCLSKIEVGEQISRDELKKRMGDMSEREKEETINKLYNQGFFLYGEGMGKTVKRVVKR